VRIIDVQYASNKYVLHHQHLQRIEQGRKEKLKCRVCSHGAKTAGRTQRRPDTCWRIMLCDKCFALMEFFNFSNHCKSYMTWFYVSDEDNVRPSDGHRGIRLLPTNSKK